MYEITRKRGNLEKLPKIVGMCFSCCLVGLLLNPTRIGEIQLLKLENDKNVVDQNQKINQKLTRISDWDIDRNRKDFKKKFQSIFKIL